MGLAAILAILLLFGSGFAEGTSLEWISAPFVKVGPFVAGLVFSQGVHSSLGLMFLGILIGVDCLIAWMIALLIIEVLMMLVHRGMHRE
jgi:hypothetical protein